MTVTRGTDRIANWKLRREFERREQLGWLTKEVVAARLGWVNSYSGRPDTSRLMRQLGLSVTHRKRGGEPYYKRKISRELATEIAEAIGVDPWEVGL